jgi:histidine triad (HIT) family protein
MNCIFCKIAKGEIPSNGLYEDDKILAFLDISPVSLGHTLVIPKEHYQSMEEISESELCSLIRVVKIIGENLKKKLNVPGYNVCLNNDPAAGQLIPHLHFHIIPRQEGDGLQPWPQGEYQEGEADKIVAKIKIS